jgi:putative protease
MQDATGKVIAKNKHLLSLKDLNLSDRLEELLDAGASSLKIEGRLKEVAYVKDVTAYYRQRLDAIFKRRKEYVRASSGRVQTTFTPLLEKSFNRGFTHHFLEGRSADIFSFDTPKSLGEEVGTVKEIRGNYLTVAGVKAFHNGDGLCYLDEKGVLHGFRVNRVDNNKLYPQEMPRIAPRTTLYRNFDQEFDKVMQRKSAERKLAVSVHLGETDHGFTLTWTDEDGNRLTQSFEAKKELARSEQLAQIRTQLGKLGNTPFELKEVTSDWTDNWFVPSSVWSDWRRQGVERLLQLRKANYRTEGKRWQSTSHSYPLKQLTYLGNVMNSKAEAFYRQHGVEQIEPAFEKVAQREVPLMFCKHCLRFSMGWCPKQQQGRSPYREPYYLVASDGKRFRLEFDCKLCQMKLYHEEDAPRG